MKIQELKEQFRNGTVDKPEYLEMMFDKHKLLFEYADELKHTDIVEINIADNGVEFVTREYGLKFFCPTPDRGIAPIGMFNMGSYEKSEADMCLSLIKPGFTIFDVGANVGWFSLIISKNIPNISLSSFEPIPATFEILNRNIAINGNLPVTTYNFGFYSEDTSLTLYYDSECSGKTSAANLAEIEVSEVKCNFKKMDTFVKDEKIRELDFVKCDVEGSEYFVYQGGLETLTKFKPIIFTEMLRKWSAKFDYHPNDIINFLNKIGYLCFVIRGRKLKEFTLMDENTLETNFIFLHEKKHAQQIREKMSL